MEQPTLGRGEGGTPTAPPRAARLASMISTAALVVAVVVAIFGFNLLANRFSQNGQNGAPSGQDASSSQIASGDQGVLLGGAPAPSFTLHDQTGATVTLDSLKGRPTIFTFFDSVCPHTDCSLMAQYIDVTGQLAGASASQVNWVALSLNPWHDTQQSVGAFLKNQHVSLPIHYLLGSQAQLQPLWDAFHMQSILQTNGIVIHTTGVYLLDSQAREQLYMDEGFDPKALASDITLLLTKGPSALASRQAAPSASDVILTHTLAGMQVTLTAAPGAYGAYNFTVLLQDSAGMAVAGATVTLDLTMPSMAMAPVHVTLTPVQPLTTGAYRADGVLSMAGEWSARVNVTPRGGANGATSATTFIFNATY